MPYLVVGLIVTRSFDPRIFKEAVEPYPDSVTLDFDFNKWLTNSNNLMYVSDKDVGLATAEYPGVYNTHWFFKSRGKAALDVAFAMHHKLFAETDARALRGLTPVDLRSARLLAKRMGYETVGIEEFLDGVYDHMVLLKENFMEKWNKRYG